MKNFLIKTALFGLLVVAMCMGIEWLLFLRPNEYSYKKGYVEKNADGIRTLILGHSHAEMGIDPEYLGDSTFNFALSGRLHYYDAVLAERYIPRMKNLKCVIWPLGYNFQYDSYYYHCLHKRKAAETPITSTYQCMYEKYMHITYNHSFPFEYWSEIINSKLNYGLRLLGNTFKERMLQDPTGYDRHKPEEKTEEWKSSQLPSYVDYDSPETPLARQEGIDNMKRIARVCRDNGVRLLVITTPYYQTYRELLTKRGLQDMQACVDSMRAVYPQLEYRNYMADKRFIEKDFFDSSHLTDVGAQKLTEIIRPWVEGKAENE